jgi:pimeloyl-ACP methyl ester carboxylesterase
VILCTAPVVDVNTAFALSAVPGPEAKRLLAQPGQTRPPMVACAIDNRGVGRSSIPRSKKDYSTKAMARDAMAVAVRCSCCCAPAQCDDGEVGARSSWPRLQAGRQPSHEQHRNDSHDLVVVQEHIGWSSAHVVGFSMGGMVACRLAADHPSFPLSLTTISSTLGRWDAVPRSLRAWRYVGRVMRDGSERTRANVDLNCHFTKRALHECALAHGATQVAILPDTLWWPLRCSRYPYLSLASVVSRSGRAERKGIRGCQADLTTRLFAAQAQSEHSTTASAASLSYSCTKRLTGGNRVAGASLVLARASATS